MAPRTHRSQTKGNAVGTPSIENESVIPLEGSTAANINSMQGKVLARRVLPWVRTSPSTRYVHPKLRGEIID